MISDDPKQRPQAKDLLLHPIFWSKAKTLQFFQDVSDRIEKIEPDDPIVLNLEKNANAILKNNWRVHICVELQNGNFQLACVYIYVNFFFFFLFRFEKISNIQWRICKRFIACNSK